MTPAAWTDTDNAQLLKLHAAGHSLHSIAKQMGRAKSTINRHAALAGLGWDRSQTAKATEAVITDARARRAVLEQRFLDEAEASLDRMWSGMEVGAFAGQDGEYKHAWIDEPSPSDRKAIMQTASTAAQAAARLAEQNAGREVDTAKSALTSLKRAMEQHASD